MARFTLGKADHEHKYVRQKLDVWLLRKYLNIKLVQLSIWRSGLHIEETPIIYRPCPNVEIQLNDDEEFIKAVEFKIATRR
jgi:hypothetical protein